MKAFMRTRLLSYLSLITLVLMPLQAQSADNNLADDALLLKFLEWHLGHTDNLAQYEADIAAEVSPSWALSDLRFSRIWHDREDGYWIYYETRQPDVRPDRNEIWRLYRNGQNNLAIDLFYFKDIPAGLEYWGKWEDPEAFGDIEMSELDLQEGCGGIYVWLEDYERFSGVNPHYACPVGNGYILQQIEISKNDEGTLIRKDWHWFFDGDGVAKAGSHYKLGLDGAYVHEYTATYPVD